MSNMPITPSGLRKLKAAQTTVEEVVRETVMEGTE